MGWVHAGSALLNAKKRQLAVDLWAPWSHGRRVDDASSTTQLMSPKSTKPPLCWDPHWRATRPHTCAPASSTLCATCRAVPWRVRPAPYALSLCRSQHHSRVGGQAAFHVAERRRGAVGGLPGPWRGAWPPPHRFDGFVILLKARQLCQQGARGGLKGPKVGIGLGSVLS